MNNPSKTEVARTPGINRPNLEKLKLLTRDLRDGKEYPRSPRETLGGYVLAGRAADKCRAVLTGQQGEYLSNCPLDQRWHGFH